jgi:hypothetical protein
MTRLRRWADTAWAARPRWWDYLYAATACVIFPMLGATLAYTLTAATIVLIGGPWVGILTWHYCYCRHAAAGPTPPGDTQ